MGINVRLLEERTEVHISSFLKDDFDIVTSGVARLRTVPRFAF